MDADRPTTDPSACVAAARIAAGSLTSEALVSACLERIEAREPQVQAWTYFDREQALAQARAADRARLDGRPLGALHGVPVGIKDIIDTRDMPTECGTPLYAGRRLGGDAAVVSLLRQAGAVIMGKTVTTELAVYAPGKTRNPHDPAHTPGGSSSGSAAAVAAGMVPLAVGSQTNGSVIRPASYCGVFGFKPSFGRISRYGVLAQSRSLDHLGVFARSVEDLALIGDCLMTWDPRDESMSPQGPARLAEVAAQEPPLPPLLGFVRSPQWDQLDPDARATFEELVEILGEECDEVALPEPFDRALDLHRTILTADLAKSFAGLYRRGREQLSESLRGLIDDGRRVLAVDYNLALNRIEGLYGELAQVFERYDAILTPATTGEAPRGLDSTGSPALCTTWTLLGTPAVSLPLMHGGRGLPIGVQLVGPRGDDGRLLRTACALAARLGHDSGA